MTRDDILRWANQCRFHIDAEDFVRPREGDYALRLERFAALVAAAEREACARVCETEGTRIDASWKSCAEAIRARSKT